MKNSTPLFIAMTAFFSLSCFAQRNDRVTINSTAENAQLLSDNMSNNDLAVVSYHVEERINMSFGSSVTTYEVSNLDMISTTDLGKNNTRTVTPKYAKTKTKALPVTVNITTPKPLIDTLATIVQPAKIDIVATPEKVKYVNIDILSTYERVIDKGYQSVDMLKRVGNSRYFDGDLVIAAKWYAQLVALTTDLDAVYYYRYAQSLKAINQIEKSNQMMALFEEKNK
jgi:hypothetical protein